MNVFKQLFKSLYSPKDIASYRSQGIGKTILYVFLLSLISVLPSVFYMNGALREAVQMASESLNELPDFTIDNGQLHSEAKEPLTIQEGSFSIIFDPTGAMDSGTVSEMGDGIALLKNEVVLSAGGGINTAAYSMLGNEPISKQDLSDLLAGSHSALPIIISLLAGTIFLVNSALKFIEVSVLALFGLILKNILARPLQYRHVWRMAAYSVTLPTLFFTVMDLLKTTVPYGFMLNWTIALIILLLAIQEIPQKDKPSLA
ncbi:DUF1189 domain-containing protein [Bacillus sp. FJAT-27251]|uniref:DUF1189 domain-containing protein n=1 Tax=Bacillus sp. FJAT-27251 TaxID=1684142 RepID=UPI0006A7AF1C|nr:DUF1189 domain-containing protein [Bacillus sp. FJAT-27251]